MPDLPQAVQIDPHQQNLFFLLITDKSRLDQNRACGQFIIRTRRMFAMAVGEREMAWRKRDSKPWGWRFSPMR